MNYTTTIETGAEIEPGDRVTYCGETFYAVHVNRAYVAIAGLIMVQARGSYPRSIALGRTVEITR